MTAGCPSASATRPRHCWTILRVSVLAVLLLTVDAESQDSDCDPEIKVRRNTSYTALLGEQLRIKCTVVFCNNSSPSISWHKFETRTFAPINFNRATHIKTQWEFPANSNGYHMEGILYLVFKNILTSDSGVYHCEGGRQISHSINVSVSGGVELTTVTWKHETNSTPSQEHDVMDTLWPYVYPAAGIIVLVIIVIIISVLSMRGCKGKSRKEGQSENQYIVIPMTEQPSPHPTLQPPPKGGPPTHHALPSRGPERIYDNAPPRRPDRKHTAPLEPNQMTVPGDNDHVYGKKKQEGERKRRKKKAEEEEESPVVYASLNHQMPPEASARPPRPKEESSEYAAICLS